MWMLIELAQDQDLQQTIRREASTALTEDLITGEWMFDRQKLVKLPTLQSVFAETLRLHMHFNLIRHVHQDGVVLDLARHQFPSRSGISRNDPITRIALPRNTMIQAPMMTAHLDESVWGLPGHPASEFWADRHIKYIDSDPESVGNQTKKRVFSMAGRPSSFFPFGKIVAFLICFLPVVFHPTKNPVLLT